ncbi:putative membrane protein [Aequitasia blattaphilus]|uniref:DUF1700 domain-containing protein n=1 Tax=Aequitasia blattaphilus TaxID=2949332 RepID=A0ABT1E8P7_9FIRM|nr:DUF1700 domain-containing protein [Aequitasia blattaphilus]MCP1102196.1 DUF1700 domain-containing protein [Aequitasia blattaphilus]MCR8614836.1 DUF1700 domain-containing protein [Aequitasia blattaphilus]
MTKVEFLSKLQEALANDLDGPIIQENINFYSQYIDDEMRKGRSQEEITEELGDPWALARTVIDSEEVKKKQSNTYKQPNTSNTYSDSNSSKRTQPSSGFSLGNFLVIVIGILILFAAISIIGGIFSVFGPIIVIVLVISLIFRLFSGGRR